MDTLKDAPVKDGTVAKLVWDGGDDLAIPEEMGKPSASQMKGTVMERVSELACRVCYDSLGRGRNSEELHKHILSVRHLSVYEHTHMTVEIALGEGCDLPVYPFLNRPGVWVRLLQTDPASMRVTFNPRVVLDWDNFSPYQSGALSPLVRDILAFAMEPLGPMIVGRRQRTKAGIEERAAQVKTVAPEIDEEKWITMFLGGSRGFSHELVRHGDFTAISQRSTRYVDEDGAPWVDHPLVLDYLREYGGGQSEDLDVARAISSAKNSARSAYTEVTSRLQDWLIKRGVTKLTARKQARGAARGYLGNALYTELIFSASVAQWKRMLRMRCCEAADAEIRSIFSKVLPELRKSRYGEAFNAFNLESSPDGIGLIAVEK